MIRCIVRAYKYLFNKFPVTIVFLFLFANCTRETLISHKRVIFKASELVYEVFMFRPSTFCIGRTQYGFVSFAHSQFTHLGNTYLLGPLFPVPIFYSHFTDIIETSKNVHKMKSTFTIFITSNKTSNILIPGSSYFNFLKGLSYACYFSTPPG